jgi:hypothetical protein
LIKLDKRYVILNRSQCSPLTPSLSPNGERGRVRGMPYKQSKKFKSLFCDFHKQWEFLKKFLWRNMGGCEGVCIKIIGSIGASRSKKLIPMF